MQYGLLICENTDNIGDDIQTFAQKRFLPKVDYYIDREQLDTFYPEKNLEEPVAVIMNAWYMYQKYNWPPSPYIYPLLISMHISQKDYFGIGSKFLDGIGREYLQEFGPVGARDQSTLNLLCEKGIDTYLSGCLTLTIQLDVPKVSNDIVYLVDLDPKTETVIRDKFPNEVFETVHHAVKYYEEKLSHEQRMKRVKDLLEKYQNAKCVITSRLHCALPCLALDTPVLLVYEEHFEDRIKSFLELLYYVTLEDIQKNKWSYDITFPPQNKETYLKIRKNLEEKCNNFIDNCKQLSVIKSLPKNSELFKAYWVDKASWQKSLLANAEVTFRNNLNKQQEWIKQLSVDKEWAESQVTNFKVRDNELQEYISELLKGKEWLERHSQEQEEYIAELLQGKDWLEQHSQNQEKYIKDLIQENNWLKTQSDEFTQEKNQMELKVSSLEEQIELFENDISKLRYKLNLLKEDKLIQKIIKMKKYTI